MHPVVVICQHRDAPTRGRLAAGIREFAHGVLVAEELDDPGRLAPRAAELLEAGAEVPLLFGDHAALATLERLDDPLRGPRRVLVGPGEEALTLLGRGAVHGWLPDGFAVGDLAGLCRNLLTEYVLHSAPHLLDRLHLLLDLRGLSGAFAAAREALQRLNERIREVERTPVDTHKLSDDAIEAEMIEEIDELLDHPRRLHYAPGELLVREGENPEAVWVILDGNVKLFRTIDGEELTFHSESAGRIVGLMSLSLHNPVFFSCRAMTQVTALRLGHEQVREAIRHSPVFSNHLITVILRSMARRNRRAAQLLIQVRTLNRRLASQRDELRRTLAELRHAQDRLVESEKMATLGNLAAGMAHELNNPVAAILRSAEFLLADVQELLESLPGLDAAAAALAAARQREPLSTRTERAARSELAAALGLDAACAARLVAAGVRDAGEVATLERKLPGLGRAELLAQIERGGQVGAALRNLTNCAQRIAALVRSLKLYARHDEEWIAGTDVNRTIDDALLILANRLRGVEVIKDYHPLPPARCIPAQLQQVWTNLAQNAAQAMADGGRLAIRTCSPAPGAIRVEFEDTGHGIPADLQARIFDPHFTSKGGRVEFGLGLGLPICHSLVERHGGTIRFESRPGLTRFTVDLPADPQPRTPRHLP